MTVTINSGLFVTHLHWPWSMLGLTALKGWTLYCSCPGFCKLSAAVGAESSGQFSQRPLLHLHVHYTITQTLLPFRYWEETSMWNFIFRSLESSEQVPRSSETLRVPRLVEIHRKDMFGFDLAPDYFWEPFSNMWDTILGRTGILAATLLCGGYPPMQMLVRHKKDAGSNLSCQKGGKSFIILENISWLFAIVPG